MCTKIGVILFFFFLFLAFTLIMFFYTFIVVLQQQAIYVKIIIVVTCHFCHQTTTTTTTADWLTSWLTAGCCLYSFHFVAFGLVWCALQQTFNLPHYKNPFKDRHLKPTHTYTLKYRYPVIQIRTRIFVK